VLCLVLPGVVAVYAFAEFVWLLRRSRRADFSPTIRCRGLLAGRCRDRR